MKLSQAITSPRRQGGGKALRCELRQNSHYFSSPTSRVLFSHSTSKCTIHPYVQRSIKVFQTCFSAESAALLFNCGRQRPTVDCVAVTLDPQTGPATNKDNTKASACLAPLLHRDMAVCARFGDGTNLRKCKRREEICAD